MNHEESSLSAVKQKTQCTLSELIQYQCRIEENRVICVPFVRIFKKCIGKPTVEITPFYDSEGNPIAPGHPASYLIFTNR
ncbi:20169_t:CDS:2 [Funneliformis geosporum]|uniref:4786_t:CDS:1 n=1 Tax=Funneliformis geosporum TaxID=1117311 RepID=A0A9W4SUK1_9GLOM|nr:20169_t:CDS:2 [Funneliformis geosporum]CAI2179615.1 4786_t:CDS:2 [Funneliformis geosporum]